MRNLERGSAPGANHVRAWSREPVDGSPMTDRTALVTGGAGYIGSHTCVVLLEAGWDVVVVDNLDNSSEGALDRVRELAPGGRVAFHRVDLLDAAGLDTAFADGPIDAVVHFA